MKYDLSKIQADYRSLLKWASDSKGWEKTMEHAARKKGMNAIKRFAYLTELPVPIAMTYGGAKLAAHILLAAQTAVNTHIPENLLITLRSLANG